MTGVLAGWLERRECTLRLLARSGPLPVCGVALDELGDLVGSLLGPVVPTVREDLDAYVGPAVVGSKVLGHGRHYRAEDVLAADQQQRDVDLAASAVVLLVQLDSPGPSAQYSRVCVDAVARSAWFGSSSRCR
jgi:hypothetical protein